MIKITQKGLNAVIEGLNPSKMAGAISETIDETADIAEKHTFRLCPEYSGEMKKSIEQIVEQNGFIIRVSRGNGFNVAAMNEFGESPYWNIGTMEDPNIYVNKKDNAGYHPFIRPSVLKAAKAFPQIFWKHWNEKRG